MALSWDPNWTRNNIRYVDENGVEHVPTDEDIAAFTADFDDDDESEVDAA